MSELPEHISTAEIRADAQMRVGGSIRPADDRDDIDELRAHCKAFIDAMGSGHQISMARTKLSEMVFWLRAFRERTRDL